MSLQNRVLASHLARKHPFLALAQPIGDIVTDLREIQVTDHAGPGFKRIVASLGNLSGAYPDITDSFGNDLGNTVLGGVGADENEDQALIRAVAEAAERYACCVISDTKVVVATANELGEDGLAFGNLLRCSPLEYAHPRCRLRPFNPDAPIRWVRGYSLTERKERLVPLVMTHLFVKTWESEQIWNPISTGVAAHTDPATAIVSAINEVVERDALTLTWLLKLRLQQILLDEEIPLDLALKFNRLQRSKVRQYLYDATTDIGVPTVYALQLTEGHKKISQFVNCASGFSMWHNCAKVIREAACGRSVGSVWGDPPKEFDDFIAIEHGAAYMGRPEHRCHFDFLTQNGGTESISSFKNGYPNNVLDQFKFLVGRFSELNMDVVLVDLTTDELRDVGLWVIRAVIPGLVPLSFSYRSRFLGHPRIYEYGQKMGLNVKSGADLNSLPQPFA